LTLPAHIPRTILRYPSGSTIVNAGDLVRGVHIIDSGYVKYFNSDKEGRITKLVIAGRGIALCLPPYITKEKARFNVQTITDVSCLFCKPDRRDPQTSNWMVDALTEIIYHFAIHTPNTITPLRTRIMNALSYLSTVFPEQDGWVNSPITRSDLAGMVGATTEATIRTITILEQEGLASFKGRRFKL